MSARVDRPDLLDLVELVELVRAGGVVVLSGAGLSTDSGIPDYRGATGAARPGTPMTGQEFCQEPAARRRYWARGFRGWPRFATLAPNAGHHTVADLEASGHVEGVITQRVEPTHQGQAPSPR